MLYCKSLLLVVGTLSFLTLHTVQIRVLMKEWDLGQATTISLTTDGKSWYLASVGEPEKPVYAVEKDTCLITIVNGCVAIDGRRMRTQALCVVSSGQEWSLHDGVDTQKIILEPCIMLVKEGDKLLLISIIDLEIYVEGVIRWESWPGWPLEMNKVCAVLARTYALYHLIKARNAASSPKKMMWYDVCGTNAHQTYKGKHRHTALQEAVQATKGQILTFEKKPIIAMYDACCGGIIPAHVTGFNFSHAPYLARTAACTYCRQCKAYEWQIVYSESAFQALLQEFLYPLKTIKEFVEPRYDQAGQLLSIKVTDGATNVVLAGKALYNKCKDIKSFCYDISKKKNKIVVEGKGLGHHVGLCQWGARAMVRKGFTMPDILQFYYPQTTLMVVKHLL